MLSTATLWQTLEALNVSQVWPCLSWSKRTFFVCLFVFQRSFGHEWGSHWSVWTQLRDMVRWFWYSCLRTLWTSTTSEQRSYRWPKEASVVCWTAHCRLVEENINMGKESDASSRGERKEIANSVFHTFSPLLWAFCHGNMTTCQDCYLSVTALCLG